MTVAEDPALRDTLEAKALAGASWLELVVHLAEAGGCLVRLAAADAALLCEAGGAAAAELPDAESFDAPRSRILDPADVMRAFAADGPVAVQALIGV